MTHYLLKPWRLLTLQMGVGALFIGSHAHPSIDWDYGVSAVMAGCAYVAAPKVIEILEHRRWSKLPLAILLTWASVDLSYVMYWYGVNPDALSMRSASFWPSLWMFLICGMVWRKQHGEM